jgi:putative hydrolase of the HAD superfamily
MIGDRQIDFAVQSFLGDIKLSTVDYLLSLKRKYTLFLLSNTNEIAFPKCREKFLSCKGIPMERVFDKLYLSYEMKLSKPDPKIFRSMISDSGILPEECLFVDDASENIAVASGLGFRTLLFDPAFNIKELVENYLKKNG